MLTTKRLKDLFKEARREKGGFLMNLANYFYYFYRRNSWAFDLRRYWNDFEDIEIDRPVFVLGFHGSGTTLLSRMIRRNEDFVSVSGNHNYWSGADEMQVVLGSLLPSELSGIRQNIPPESGLKQPTTWIYASDKYLPYYRKTKKDATPELKKKFRNLIRWQIARHAGNDNARFTDKSQVFTVKVSLIKELLKNTNPKFVLLLRNPYAMCFRRARQPGGSMRKNNINNYKDRLRVTCEHFYNSVESALEDTEQADLKVVRFEDLLQEPRKQLKEICSFIETDFTERMIPSPEDKVPFGSLGKNKWYPLRPDVNQKYFDKMSQEDVDFIHGIVKKYAKKFDYEKPEIK